MWPVICSMLMSYETLNVMNLTALSNIIGKEDGYVLLRDKKKLKYDLTTTDIVKNDN